MAAAVLTTPGTPVFNHFHMVSHQRISPKASQPAASSSRSPNNPPEVPEATTKTFKRIRSSLEQSIRTATRSRTKPPPQQPADDFGTITTKGKETATKEDTHKATMFRKLEHKVGFRRSDSTTPSPSPVPPHYRPHPGDKDASPQDKVRAAGFTSYLTPSLRQASMSSPAIHLSSQIVTSPKSQAANFSLNNSAFVSPPRDRTRRASIQPAYSKEISGPSPLIPKRSTKETSRERKSKPPPIVPPSSSLLAPNHLSVPETPSRRSRDHANSPDTPTPNPRGSGYPSRRTGAGSGNHLPLDSPPASPAFLRDSSPSPARARSPTSPTRASSIKQREKAPSSSTHLPPSSNPTPGSRRPSIDADRRPSDSPTRNRAASPSASIRPRAASPPYAQNRHFNISTASLLGLTNPEHREMIRNAISLLCKELARPPAHLGKSETGAREWEEVEVRMRALVRLERIWGKSRSIAMGSSSQVNGTTGAGSNGLSAAGEEREKRLFGEALRDGFVLCQLVNKLRPNSITRINPREDAAAQNLTKFLSSCSRHGIPSEELFARDDLIEATSESLARVARTITALLRMAEAPSSDRSKVLYGQNMKNSDVPDSPTSPYGRSSSSRATTSTPNLSVTQLQRSTSPTVPSSPTGHKRWTPSPGLPTVRSDSPEGSSGDSSDSNTALRNNSRDPSPENMDGLPVMKPPPRSPLRAQSQSKRAEDIFTPYMTPRKMAECSSIAESTQVSLGDSVRDSMVEFGVRQSVASSNLTETSAYSSLLDVGQYSGHNKYGTIRTVTTEATSIDSPSFTRAEASSIASSLVDEMARRRGMDSGVKFGGRERRPSETAVVDLSRVAEESEEMSASGSSSKDLNRKDKDQLRSTELETERRSPIRLGKAKWPEDFMDAFQPKSSTRPIPIKSSSSPNRDEFTRPNGSPLSISPPRNVIDRRNESLESLPQFPRRPSHRVRHSVDLPILAPKDASPDGLPSSRLMLRRNSSRGAQRNGVYLPRGNPDDFRSSKENVNAAVPFPRTNSGDYSAAARTTSPASSDERPAEGSDLNEKPRIPRGRFQSEIEGASGRRRSRPDSSEGLANKQRRTRFESMVNLGMGIGSSNASASDLMSRDSLDGSAVRQTLIVREEGKPPTSFQLGNCIGRGQFGSVYRALNLNTGQMVAVKRIRLEGLKEEEVTQLMKEVDLVKSLSHPSIVKYEGMARDNNSLSIVLEYAENGSLGQTLKAFGKLNERLVASYVLKILEGLDYLHQSDVVHCDLKAANILTTKNGNVKLSDFGVSLNLRAMEREIKDVAGTPNWMAPEVIELKGASTKSDIWSLACTVIELLTGRPPYGDIANSMTVMFRIVEDDMPPIPEGCSDSLQDFLRICFNKDPTLRPSAETLFEHEWLKKNWGLHKELRPQDSIPFLRRVSADLQKSEAIRYLSQIEMPVLESPVKENPPQAEEFVSGSPVSVNIARRMSNGLSSSKGENDGDAISPREHSFVKTTFSKAMTCKVCLLSVKKSAVLCEQCSLIAHSKCAPNAPPTCDLRSQLLLYAQYAEKGLPGSQYSNPLELLNGQFHPPTSPTSEGSLSVNTPRASLDNPPPPGTPIQLGPPPTAYRFMAALKRSRSNLTPEPAHSSQSSSPVPPSQLREAKKFNRTQSILKRNRERPPSISSNNTSSMRSAVESFTTNQDPSRASAISATDTDTGTRGRLSTGGSLTQSQTTSSSAVLVQPDTIHHFVPGDLSADTRRPKKQAKDSKSRSNCTVQ